MRARPAVALFVVCLVVLMIGPLAAAHAQEVPEPSPSPSADPSPTPVDEEAEADPSENAEGPEEGGKDDTAGEGSQADDEGDDGSNEGNGPEEGKGPKDGKGKDGKGPKGGKGDPPGNNGTIKIESDTLDDIPNNVPHPGCEFLVEFYNYDEGSDLQATYTFENQPPSGTGELLTGTVAIGEDPAEGGRDLDARVRVDLTQALAESGAEAHPKQGFHVKLTVHADGSIGADVKHKVFWIERCESQVLAAVEELSSPGEVGADVMGDRATRGSDAVGADVQAAGLRQAQQPASGRLAVTGSRALVVMMVIGVAFALAGLWLVRAAGRRGGASQSVDETGL